MQITFKKYLKLYYIYFFLILSFIHLCICYLLVSTQGFCGPYPPYSDPLYNIVDNEFFIAFSTDDVDNRKGFLLHYRAIPSISFRLILPPSNRHPNTGVPFCITKLTEYLAFRLTLPPTQPSLSTPRKGTPGRCLCRAAPPGY